MSAFIDEPESAAGFALRWAGVRTCAPSHGPPVAVVDDRLLCSLRAVALRRSVARRDGVARTSDVMAALIEELRDDDVRFRLLSAGVDPDEFVQLALSALAVIDEPPLPRPLPDRNELIEANDHIEAQLQRLPQTPAADAYRHAARERSLALLLRAVRNEGGPPDAEGRGTFFAAAFWALAREVEREVERMTQP